MMDYCSGGFGEFETNLANQANLFTMCASDQLSAKISSNKVDSEAMNAS
jgi:hypothetical protein